MGINRSVKNSESRYIIDINLVEYRSIIDQIPSESELHVISDANDLISKISHLAQEPDTASIHVLTHGTPGAAVLSSGKLDLETLRRHGEDLAAIRAAAPQVELLLYGCEIGAGPDGAAFVAGLSELTGLTVAASRTPTGAATLGGDWTLDAASGPLRSAVLSAPLFPGLLAAPTLSGLSPVALDEGDTLFLAPTLNVAGGTNYSGGSLTFRIDDAQAGDQLTLVTDADQTMADAITVDNGIVYYGSGSSRIQVGIVDDVENGQNGQPLTIRFVREFANAGFENGTSDWTIGTQQVVLGTTLINGIVTPVDTTIAPNSGGDSGVPSSMGYYSELSTSQHTEGTQALRLYNNGTTGAGYDVVHGPYAYSSTFGAVAGDTFTFDWQAAGGSDAFDVFGYLMKADGSESVVVLDATGASTSGIQPWTEVTVSVPSNGDWFFVFVAGTYDFTGGQAAGGSLYIDNFRVGVSGLSDSIVASLARNVSYHADDEATAPRDVTVAVTDGAGDVETLTTSLTVENVNNPPSGGVTLSGAPTEGQVLSAVNGLTDPDGIASPLQYQWQRLGPDGNWSDISGATDATFTLGQSEVGLNVRAVVRYVDGDGVSEQAVTAASARIANTNDLPTGTVSVSGTAARYETLTATSDVADEDGLGAPLYRWQRLGSDGTWRDIDGAVASTYRLTQADVGLQVRAVLGYVDAGGTAETVVSLATGPIGAVNFAPTAGADSFQMALADGAVVLDLLANDTDPDGDTLRLTAIDGQSLSLGTRIALDSGTVAVDASGRVVFTPFLTHSGTVAFDYTISDGQGGTAHGTVTGVVETDSDWQDDIGPAVSRVAAALGLGADFDINELIYIASVVAPGALDTAITGPGSGTGYERMPGYELTPGDLSPDQAQLLSSLFSIWLAKTSATPGIADADDAGALRSTIDQSLLFQTELADSGDVDLAYGDGGAGYQDAPSSGWSRTLALQSLRSDVTDEQIRQWDRISQGRLLQDVVGTGDEIAVRFGTDGAATPQSALSGNLGLLDFMSADSRSAVTVARPVAIAETLGDADDQVVVVQTRQNGMHDVSLMLYRVDDLTGTINGIAAGDAGYTAAATARAYQTEDGASWIAGGGYGAYAEDRVVGIDDGDIVALRLRTSAGGDFFSFAAANSDGPVTHLWNYGLNIWGWEDLAGGGDRDYNDLVVRLDFVSAALDEILA